MSTPASSAKAGAPPAAVRPGRPPKQPDRRLRTDDVLRLMVADGLVGSTEADAVGQMRTRAHQHPLELIAAQQWRMAKPPGKLMTLEWLVEWLAGKLKIPYQHIDPLKIDLAAVTATMSNAIGLVAGGVSGTWGYRRELRGQWHRLRWQIPGSVLGAILGSWLLLHLPEKVFQQVVPVLLVGALVLVIIGPRIQTWARTRAEAAGRSAEHVTPARMAALVAGTFAVGVYGGYFTAAQGILLIAVMGALLPEDMQRMNAAKNLLSLLVNVVAAAAYILVAFDRISWEAAGLIAVGSLIGGFLGAHYGRRLSPNALRAVIVVVGLIGLYRLLQL